jgi:uncharacterized protein YprB with RNaseH-like and TPR domain
VSSLRSKLSRLSSFSAPEPPSSAKGELLDDLRARIHAVIARSAERAPPPPRAVDTSDLPFVTEETPLGPLHVRAVRLGASHRTGRAPVLPARDASAELLALLALDPSLAACDPSRALYLDTETTGLSGGTGTVAFLVGLAYWEPPNESSGGALVVEQLLVRALGEEAPMLERVASRIRESSMLVTFNGKSFDMPLLRTRFVMARMDAVVEPPHLDLLHLARRLHKPRGVACNLTSIEREILGFERFDDTPSGEVSACYLHFLRTGETRALLGVVEHNAWDVVAMASLVGLYGEPLAGSQLVADDLVGVARTLRRAGDSALALDVANAAVERGAGPESLRARAEIAKARGDRQRALQDFEALAESIDDARARLELAKLYEHFVKEPARALAIIEQGTPEREEQTSKRKARLRRKIERSPQAELALASPSTRKNR